jgi:general secretion pathway protein C
MRLFVHPEQAPSQVITAGQAALVRGDVSRLLGSNPVAQAVGEAPLAQPDFAGRFRLAGVAAPKHHGGPGLAIISVDGNPPRVYRVGAVIDTDLVLHDVSWRTATIVMAHRGAYNGPEVILEMPALAAPETGVLPPPLLPGSHGSSPEMPGGAFNGSGMEGRDALSGMEPPGAGRISRGARSR